MTLVDFTYPCFSYGADQPVGLIVLRETGVRWNVQTSGTLCAQKAAEGLFVPLNLTDDEEFTRLWLEQYALYDDLLVKWREAREQLLAQTDELFRDDALYGPLPLVCDRERGADSAEAWVYVQVLEDSAGRSGEIHPLSRAFGGERAVLVWQNSD